jgi:hypothetical protein
LLYCDSVISTTFLTNISHFFLQNNYANVDLIVEIAENQRVDGKCKFAGISRFVYWSYELIVLPLLFSVTYSQPCGLDGVMLLRIQDSLRLLRRKASR